MSGPIVRQYGVPNYDEIFGKKESDRDPTGENTNNPAAEPQANAPIPTDGEKVEGHDRDTR